MPVIQIYLGVPLVTLCLCSSAYGSHWHRVNSTPWLFVSYGEGNCRCATLIFGKMFYISFTWFLVNFPFDHETIPQYSTCGNGGVKGKCNSVFIPNRSLAKIHLLLAHQPHVQTLNEKYHDVTLFCQNGETQDKRTR